MATKDRSLKPCRCSLFEVGEFDAEKDGAEFTTECDRQTNNLFAQGHDARLVSFLVRGQLDGYEIRTVQGGVSVTFPGAFAAASSVSEALGRKAEKMLAVAAKKAEAKAQREAAKKAKTKQAANTSQVKLRPLTEEEGKSVMAQIFAANPPHEEPAAVKGKVGRWTYEGTELNGAFHYTPKLGGPKVAAAGSWTRV